MDNTGVADGIYVNFFGVDGHAAMLACDAHGVAPQSLLFRPKETFVQLAASSPDELALVRYTLAERSRQATFRTLMGVKATLLSNTLLMEEQWAKRCAAVPGAISCPVFTPQALRDAAQGYDTDSSDDEDADVDERGMMKPHPPRSSQAPLLSGDDSDGSLCTLGPLSTAPSLLPTFSPRSVSVSWAGEASCGSEDPQRVACEDSGPPLPYESDSQRGVHRHHGKNSSLLRATERTCHGLSTIPKARHCPAALHGDADEAGESGDEKRHKRSDSSRGARRKHSQCRSRGASRDRRKRHSFSLPSLGSAMSSSGASGVVSDTHHQREMTAMKRVAFAQLADQQSRHEQAKAFEEESRAFPAVGTVEHTLKAKKLIGVVPSFDERAQTVQSRDGLRRSALLRERETQHAQMRVLEAKNQATREAMEAACERTRGISADARRIRERSVKKRHEAADREQAAHLDAVLHCSAERHVKADTFVDVKRSAGAVSRQRHEQERLFREQLRDALHDQGVQGGGDTGFFNSF